MKILIASISTGSGHVKAAEALLSAFEAQAPFVQVVHVDMRSYLVPTFQKLYVGGYDFVVNNAPTVWGALYNLTNRPPTSQSGTWGSIGAIQRTCAQSFLNYVRKERFDRIIATHFLVAQVLQPFAPLGSVEIPLDMVVTDYEFHHFWLNSMVDHYYVGSLNLLKDLVLRGVDESRVSVTGIPVHPKFSSIVVKDQPLVKLGLDPYKKTILIMFGGSGVGPTVKIINAFSHLSLPLQVITVSGRNGGMLKQLRRLKTPPHIQTRHLGFVDNVDELMACADLVISKSGGLTTAECLAIGVPMLVYSPIPGQEERNARFIEDHNAGIRMRTVPELTETVVRLMTHPSDLLELRRHAKMLGRPHAAEDVVNDVLSRCRAFR